MKTFGYKLRELRLEHGLTQERFVEEIDNRYQRKISKSMISKWENDREEPQSFQDVIILADYFGVKADYLIGVIDDKYGEDIKYKQIPILGTIAAGIPIAAQEDILDYEYILPNEDLDFCLKVKGNSMISARIFDGDIVYVRKQDIVENGEIAAIQIDGEEVALKRFYRENGRVILHSENPTIPDLIFTSKDKKLIRVLGKVVYVKFEVR